MNANHRADAVATVALTYLVDLFKLGSDFLKGGSFTVRFDILDQRTSKLPIVIGIAGRLGISDIMSCHLHSKMLRCIV